MSEVRVPDIGDFTDVPVIEILVSVGDAVAPEDPLVTLESDKATMDVPAPSAGTVTQLRVSIGDRVSEGSVLLMLEGERSASSQDDGAGSGEGDQAGPSQDDGVGSGEGERAGSGEGERAGSGESERAGAGESERAGAGESERAGAGDSEPPPSCETDAAVMSEPPAAAADQGERDAQVVVLGAGPGGYTAAFRAADLGLKTVLIERYEKLGGVCLNVGCIPSKALLHAARVVAETEEMAVHGISFGKPRVNVQALMAWKTGVVDRLTGGLVGLAKQRKVEVVHRRARFAGPHSLEVGERTISFEHCIIAAGSQPAQVPGLPEDPRITDSTAALSPASIPGRLLVIGGGIIGLEMATVYNALGAKVTVVEMLEQLMPGCDPDLVRPLQKRIAGRYEAIHLGARVASVRAQKNGLKVEIEGVGARIFDQVLVAVGRVPNGRTIGADAAGVAVDERGFITVDRKMRTNIPWIHAIGDIVGGPMLAHKASHEGKVAAEVIAGHDVEFDARAVPSVAYTDPEVAWMGLTETGARAEGVEYERAVFPWGASGRALALGREDGLTKLLLEPGSRRVLGAGIVGVGAGELIAETVLALEMGADAEDLALTVHPHPTLSETVGFAAEMAAGTITDLIAPKRAAA